MSVAIHDQLFNKTIASARKAANEIDDPRLKVWAWAAIASITHNPSDLREAREKALKVDHYSLRAELLVVIAKSLAEARHFKEARETASMVQKLDQYWHAEAWIYIARFSGEDKDAEQAEKAVSGINTPHLRAELMADAKLREPSGPNGHFHQIDDLKDLVKALTEIKGFEDAHSVATEMSSAHLRFRVLKSMASIVAEAMK